ncbi:MAG TPA: 50S ribosomal protein L11 methyltransferase [Casimicrobiaceae bacterium]|nr:50S ribosomal protein L11 methyltransferase [Casimicrobiaceae bacterium]
MSFLALEFDANAADAERWADALLDAGALAVDTADPHAGTDREIARYGEPNVTPSAVDLWPVCRLSALFAQDADVGNALARVSVALGATVPAHAIAAIADDDWVRQTQQQFQPICVAPNLWIVPSWCEPVDAKAINLRLDPGLAFGTGSHPTTRMCLRWLALHVSGGETVLDYGCGSGILAIAAAKLGARAVDGIDVDTQAITASRDNAKRNDVAARFDLPEAFKATRYDVVVANILANPLQLLAPLLASHVRAGGHVVLSGILEPQAAAVAAAYERWFTIDVWNIEEGWVALAGSRMNDDD